MSNRETFEKGRPPLKKRHGRWATKNLICRKQKSSIRYGLIRLTKPVLLYACANKQRTSSRCRVMCQQTILAVFFKKKICTQRLSPTSTIYRSAQSYSDQLTINQMGGSRDFSNEAIQLPCKINRLQSSQLILSKTGNKFSLISDQRQNKYPLKNEDTAYFGGFAFV